ncbi:MAG: TonB family protein [bacterium]
MSMAPMIIPQRPPRGSGIGIKHVLVGILAALAGSGIATAIPEAGVRVWGPPAHASDSLLPHAAQVAVRTVAPDSVLFPDHGPVIFAGPLPVATPAPVSESATGETPSTAKPPEGTPALPPPSPPSIGKPWLATELPPTVARRTWSCWVKVRVTASGVVESAELVETSGDTTVDSETLERLKKTALAPATRDLANGTPVPVPYDGRLYVTWVSLNR